LCGLTFLFTGISNKGARHGSRWLGAEPGLDGAGNERTNGGVLCRRSASEFGVKIVWNIDRGSDAHAIIMSCPDPLVAFRKDNIIMQSAPLVDCQAFTL
jgi:hypothetical protein